MRRSIRFTITTLIALALAGGLAFSNAAGHGGTPEQRPDDAPRYGQGLGGGMHGGAMGPGWGGGIGHGIGHGMGGGRTGPSVDYGNPQAPSKAAPQKPVPGTSICYSCPQQAQPKAGAN